MILSPARGPSDRISDRGGKFRDSCRYKRLEVLRRVYWRRFIALSDDFDSTDGYFGEQVELIEQETIRMDCADVVNEQRVVWEISKIERDVASETDRPAYVLALSRSLPTRPTSFS